MFIIRLAPALLLLLLTAGPAFAQIDVEYNPEEPHHLSVFLGGTHLTEENTEAFTVGIDYEYRVSRLLGLGFVAERAVGDIDSTTLLAVADIHVWRGFAVQLGPGVELVDGNAFAVARVGGLYEVEFEPGFTLSPQVHYDFSGAEDALVFGVALGFAF